MIGYGAELRSNSGPEPYVWEGMVDMKRLNRMLILFLVVLLSFSLVGCGKKEETVDDVDSPTETWELNEEETDSEDSWDLDWEDTSTEGEEGADSDDALVLDWEDTSTEDEDYDWGVSFE